jgi:hypothetical protein
MQNRKTINNYLGNRGLSTLDDPQGLCQQLGFLVEDDKHFMQLLNKCQPQYRRDMYEALRPHLRFAARPLDVYIAELGMEAEIQQLPTIDGDGKLRAFRLAEIRTVENVVEETLSKLHLTLTCIRCTREETFHGGTKGDVIYKARAAGWTYGLDKTGQGHEICPECPATKN